jgi:hypothetical protein
MAPRGSQLQNEQGESTYDDSRMRPRDGAQQAEVSGRSVQYDDSRMEPGEVIGPKQDPDEGRRVQYDDSRMEPGEVVGPKQDRGEEPAPAKGHARAAAQ